MNNYWAAILFFLPAGIANMAPVLAKKVPFVNKIDWPMDLNLKWRGKRLLGKNKTWRGLLAGVLLGGITAVVVAKLNHDVVVNIAPFWVGCLLGFGALIGDAIESFFKRQLDVKPGHSWFPFDQTDYIIGGLIIIMPFVDLPLWASITILVTYFGMHIIVAYIGFLLGLKDKPI
ncbi:MAG: CDP-archaeol synthase [Candidatus Saccharimonadales bacterium]